VNELSTEFRRRRSARSRSRRNAAADAVARLQQNHSHLPLGEALRRC
jgi:hypothetical protein